MNEKPTRALTVIGAQTVAQRVATLQSQARALAADHVGAFSAGLADLQRTAAEIAEGGEAYSPGVRNLARRLAEHLESEGQTLEAIRNRNP